MKKALVLGASGGMGYSIVKELSARGISVIAFARTRSKLEKSFAADSKVTIFPGDLFKLDDLREAAKGVDVIFHAANIPYEEWEAKLQGLISNILTVAKEESVKLAMVDNIYAYGRAAGKKVNELSPKNPHTKKGKVRLQVETTIKDSSVPTLIAHFPDFYGPNAENTLLHHTLKDIVRNKKSRYVGDQKIAREFIFTPDGAKAIINLALNDEAYGQNWNIPGYGVISGEELIETLRQIRNYDKKVSTITKNMIRFLGLFNAGMREVVEMFYLNEEPVVLDGQKYERFIGPIPRTPYKEGLERTLKYMISPEN
ncbi:SDR family NAD(P)-dependent oxidoreductase [Neobacillus vireti]|uniref:Saccharopine dehydrogenase n=1 Tax=Neobacillus vireti LMG 21834 TaxID=1131730 RepID=A0AB94IRQ3_9BACI|nr:SDR family NAD(P)-dependent oxidoreductase [Neobacillus vireti]ETI69771.1 saccharopine dehydrogenase [Neobacillus vireti LMG 21834]KLT17869.1 NADH-ubiquinone oxidoreductase [Neobacillus vireti]